MGGGDIKHGLHIPFQHLYEPLLVNNTRQAVPYFLQDPPFLLCVQLHIL